MTTNTVKLKRHPYGYVTLDDRYIVQQDATETQDGCGCIICQQGSGGCPRGGWRVDTGWVVWDQQENDYLRGTGPLEFKTKRDAAEYLADAIAERDERDDYANLADEMNDPDVGPWDEANWDERAVANGKRYAQRNRLPCWPPSTGDFDRFYETSKGAQR